jgi:hypothetical protein
MHSVSVRLYTFRRGGAGWSDRPRRGESGLPAMSLSPSCIASCIMDHSWTDRRPCGFTCHVTQGWLWKRAIQTTTDGTDSTAKANSALRHQGVPLLIIAVITHVLGPVNTLCSVSLGLDLTNCGSCCGIGSQNRAPWSGDSEVCRQWRSQPQFYCFYSLSILPYDTIVGPR